MISARDGAVLRFDGARDSRRLGVHRARLEVGAEDAAEVGRRLEIGLDLPSRADPIVSAPIHTWNMGLMAAGTLGLWVAWSPLVNWVQYSLLQWYPKAAPIVAAALP